MANREIYILVFRLSQFYFIKINKFLRVFCLNKYNILFFIISSPSITERLNAGKAKSYDFLNDEDDLFSARRRAAKAINEDGILDTRSGRFAAKTNAIEDDFDDQVF